MMIDYFDELLKQPSLFKDESKLDINFVPNNLLHREKELYVLSQLFLVLITNPNSTSRKILITGKTGVGKTATVKFFGKMIIEAAVKRHIFIKHIHVNCRKERTSYKVLIKIMRTINNNFPKRGYSPQELLEIILEHLNNQELHLLIVLDELSYLINDGGDLIYSLTRINDDSINSKQRVSIIGIVRDITCLSKLDASTMSTLQRNIIDFKNYSKEETFDILKFRAKISLIDNAISDELMNSITELVHNKGDIRYGLNLIWRACKIAERKHLRHINTECIRLGNQDLIPFSPQDILTYLNEQKLIFLLSITRGLKKSGKTQISLAESINIYKIICENLDIDCRSYSQLWNYLQEFKRDNIISVLVQSESFKGRKGLIEIAEFSLIKLEAEIIRILKSKGLSI
ncbi:MAG: AAA family ATPase [Candidatus Lokiarchaeota archaeon]|nr:AAA family ATPase [Candidatus Lokiarchaeota archaeon]